MVEPKPRVEKTLLCPICERPAIEPRYRPFCSRRCADIDLGRWFNESYRVPAKQPSEDEDEDPAAPAGEAKNRED